MNFVLAVTQTHELFLIEALTMLEEEIGFSRLF